MPIFVLSMKKAKKFTAISCLLLVLCMTGNAHRSLAGQRIKTEQKKALPQYSRVQIPEDSIASVNKKKALGFKVKDASWQGTYEYYLQASELPPVFVGYTLDIKRNSCIFEGNGQMVTFRILCVVKSESESELTLVYGRSLSEMNSLSQSLQRSPSLVKLYRHNGKYYLQSPCIVDKKGRANVKVACEKLKASN